MAVPANPIPALPGQIQRNVLGIVAGACLLLFSALWKRIGYRLLSFDATAEHGGSNRCRGTELDQLRVDRVALCESQPRRANYGFERQHAGDC